MTETLAKKRIFIGTLPGMAEPNRREHDCLTLNGSDLMPLEAPWRGTTRSPLILVESPFRQLIPFSMFDPGLGDSNLLIMAKSGALQNLLAQQFLLMAARSNPRISIIERGDSYRPLVELMGGQGDRDEPGILRNHQSLGPGTGEKPEPTKEKVAFLRNLTRYMIGDKPEFGFRAAGQHYHRGHLQHLQTEVFSPLQSHPDLYGFGSDTLHLERQGRAQQGRGASGCHQVAHLDWRHRGLCPIA